jgi:ankyrin repeat protein
MGGHIRSAIHIAWTRIFGKLADESTTEAFSTMFGDEEYLDSRQFPPFHKIVLGLNGANLAEQLDLTADRIDDRDADGRTALSWAAARGDDDAVSQLLRVKANPDIAGHDRRTPLHWAAQSGNSRTLEILLKHNANMKLKDQWKRTPLQYASCNHNDTRYLEILIAHGADVNAQDCHERTALGYAAKHNHHESVKCLLENDADPTIADNWGFTPLFEAAKSTHNESLRQLVQYPARYGGQTIQKQSLLHVIAAHGDQGTVRLLNPSNLRHLDWSQRDHQGHTPMDLFRKRRVKPFGLAEVFENLSGAPPERTLSEDFESTAPGLREMELMG